MILMAQALRLTGNMGPHETKKRLYGKRYHYLKGVAQRMRKNLDHLYIYQMVSVYNIQRTKTEPLNIRERITLLKMGHGTTQNSQKKKDKWLRLSFEMVQHP